MWVCGLKHVEKYLYIMDFLVTPYVGVWIETPCTNQHETASTLVTPYVGVCIETTILLMIGL